MKVLSGASEHGTTGVSIVPASVLRVSVNFTSRLSDGGKLPV